MSSIRRKSILRHPAVVNAGCGCHRRSKLSFLFSTFTKPTTQRAPSSPSTTATTTSHRDTIPTATSSSSSSSPSPSYGAAEKRGRKKRVEAVVKESSDPYLDFRDSMLAMIVEYDMYGMDDLRDLVGRLLALNAPHHHHLILRAFAEIWDRVFSPEPDRC